MKEKRKLPTSKLRKTGRSYDESIRLKVVQELKAGFLSHRAASRKYGIDRKTLDNWVTQSACTNLPPLKIAQIALADMKEDIKIKVLAKQVLDLTKALEQSQLKTIALETMIEVAESDLHIKIRKKRGTKQS